MLLSNKLVSLLKTFSKRDLNHFKKYLASPFFNEDKEIEKLYHIVFLYFKKKQNNKETNHLLKTLIWKEIFPTKTYNDVKLRRLSSDLTKHAFAYLAYKNYKHTPIREQTFLLQELCEPALIKQYESVKKQTQNSIERQALKDADFHLYSFLIRQSEYSLYEKSRKNFSNSLEQADFHLDCFYFLNKLKAYCDVLSYKSFLSTDLDIHLFPAFFSYLNDSHFQKLPSIYAYYLIVNMLSQPSKESYFFDLKQFLFENYASFYQNETNALFTHLINYCIHEKINAGNHRFLTELFEIHKFVLDKQIIIIKNKLDFYHYKNIIKIGLLIKEYNWVEYFIQKYKTYLPKEHQENAWTYNLAKVYFSQKKYEQVIGQLRDVEYKDPVYVLGGKLILIKTYYELKEFLALDSLIDSFRIYIRRNKLISKEVKQQYLNMLRFVKKLSKMLPGDQKTIAKVYVQIDRCKALAGKKWILEKVEEFS